MRITTQSWRVFPDLKYQQIRYHKIWHIHNATKKCSEYVINTIVIGGLDQNASL